MDVSSVAIKSFCEVLEEQKWDLADLKQLANKIHDGAKNHGLDQQDICRIIKVCTRHDLNPVVAGTLAKSLIPRENIPEDSVICALSRICSGKLSLQVQKLMLEWIAQKFCSIYPKSNIHTLYGMIFNILDNDFLCAPACHLLCLMTRDEDVSYLRIRQLAECQRRAGTSPCIRNLLKLMRASSLTSAAKDRCSTSANLGRKQMFLCSSLLVGLPYDYSTLFKESSRRPLAERQHIIAISAEEDVTPHLVFWLQHHLSRLIEGSLDQIDYPDILKSMLMMKSYLKKTYSIWGAFLYDFLDTWNGHDHCDMVLNFIAKIPLPYFTNLRDRVFEVLKKVFMMSHDLVLQFKVIESLSELTCGYIIECVQTDGKTKLSSLLLVRDLIRFVENMVLEYLLLNKNDCAIFHAVLEYWEMVSSSLLSNRVAVALVPHFYFVYKALFGLSSAHLSSMCGTLHHLLLISRLNHSTKSRQNIDVRVSETYKVLCLHDARNFLHNRGFVIQPATSTRDVDEKGKCTQLNSRPCFCLQKHPGLLPYVAAYNQHNSNDPVTDGGFAHYLESEGFIGITNFLGDLLAGGYIAIAQSTMTIH